MLPVAGLGSYAVLVAYGVGALLAAGSALWIARSPDRSRPDRAVLLLATILIALWCASVVALGVEHPVASLAETARNLAFIALIFRQFSADGRADSLKPIRPVIGALALVQMCQPILLLINTRAELAGPVLALSFQVSAILSMLVAIGALMLLHNLYAGATAASRIVLRWSGAALAGIFAFDLNFYMFAYLAGELPDALAMLRGLFAGAMTALLAFGGNSVSQDLRFRPSRAVTFQTLSLVVIGGYLLVMLLASRALALLGGDIARAGQVFLVVLGLALAAAWVPSRRIRGWLRVTAAKHLFQHRYDYRQEWLRFTETIARGSKTGASLQERAVKAIADITESPGGLLLLSNEEAQLELTARWNWPTIEVPSVAGDYKFSELLEQRNYILDLADVRAGIDRHGETVQTPQWLREAEDVWALVPLLHFDRLVGAVVLAKPPLQRSLDWEDFDLLRVVGQQLASYLAEQAGQQALMDASRFDEFNRRIAFVMHDIKNLASQMSLLSANAQKHADNPAFREDMLVTLRKSSEKLTALLARLGRYGAGPAQDPQPVDLAMLAGNLIERFKGVHPVVMAQADRVSVMGNLEALDQALVHLIQNAVDASPPSSPIHIAVTGCGDSGEIEIVDSGHGMPPEFVRNGLFKPFVSSKEGGFGIGAFEAREMIRAMGGRVMVESREGLGTRFVVALPLAEAQERGQPSQDKPIENQEVA